jgi:hypothetical protein
MRYPPFNLLDPALSKLIVAAVHAPRLDAAKIPLAAAAFPQVMDRPLVRMGVSHD